MTRTCNSVVDFPSSVFSLDENRDKGVAFLLMHGGRLVFQAILPGHKGLTQPVGSQKPISTAFYLTLGQSHIYRQPAENILLPSTAAIEV